MERAIPFRQFVDACRAADAHIVPVRLLKDAQTVWNHLPEDVRTAVLEKLAIPVSAVDGIHLHVGKLATGPSTLDNVLVTISWETPEQDAEADVEADAAAEEIPLDNAPPTADSPAAEMPAEAVALAANAATNEAADNASGSPGHDHAEDEVEHSALASHAESAPDDAAESTAFPQWDPSIAFILPEAERAAEPRTEYHVEDAVQAATPEGAIHDADASSEDRAPASQMDAESSQDEPRHPVLVTAEEMAREVEEPSRTEAGLDDDEAQAYASLADASRALVAYPENNGDPHAPQDAGAAAATPENDGFVPDAVSGSFPATDPEGDGDAHGGVASDAGEVAKGGLFSRLFKKKGSEAADSDEPITVIPPAVAPFREVEVYAVQDPYVFVRILYNDEKHEYIYETIEPTLTEREKNILEFVEDTLIDTIEVGLGRLGVEEAANLLRKHVDEIIFDYSIVLSPRAKEKLVYYILRDFLGFGKLDPMMRDGQIEDISCDGPEITIFVYHRKYESFASNVMFLTDEEADSFVIRLAQRSGKHISIAEPLLDATLPDGSRLNATLSDEVTANGSTFTIRKFKPDPFTPPDLVRFGTMNEDILAYWWLAVQNGASAIYAGGTASGKTTSLNAILLFIPPQMKIVSIEDTREVNLPHPNWIPGVTRSGFGPRDSHGRQAGEIDMFTLLKAALRQRPEYILVGEVRGQEAYALFQAMATGHTAYGTMHADSAESVIHRLESAPISIPRSLLEALDIVSIQIQTRIGDKRVRRTKEIVEIVGLDPHTREILTNEVFNWDPTRDEFDFSGVSYVLERIQMERNMSAHDMKLEMEDRKLVIRWMIAKGLRDYREVAKVIQRYYKEKDKLMAEVRREMEHGFATPDAEEIAPPVPEAPQSDPGPDPDFDAFETGSVETDLLEAGQEEESGLLLDAGDLPALVARLELEEAAAAEENDPFPTASAAAEDEDDAEAAAAKEGDEVDDAHEAADDDHEHEREQEDPARGA